MAGFGGAAGTEEVGILASISVQPCSQPLCYLLVSWRCAWRDLALGLLAFLLRSLVLGRCGV
eukprot:600627-Alexandrium_andersonii.AAC.1